MNFLILTKKTKKEVWWNELTEETDYEINKIYFNEIVIKKLYI
jgi:hypothetical protein